MCPKHVYKSHYRLGKTNHFLNITQTTKNTYAKLAPVNFFLVAVLHQKNKLMLNTVNATCMMPGVAKLSHFNI